MHLVSTLAGLQDFKKAKITQYNIEYRLQYALFFTLLNYHRNRLFFLLFGELSNIDYFFTFLSVDSQPCMCALDSENTLLLLLLLMTGFCILPSQR